MNKHDILIVGAGPTGLVLALWLKKTGINVRIIDKADKPGTTSRALVFHARNLEFYRQMGIDNIALERGIEFKAANLWVKGKKEGSVPFADMGKGISKYAYSLIIPQDQQEQLLTEQLEQHGVKIERSTELLSYSDNGNRVTATLRKANGAMEECTVRYVAGCDGAKSTVRQQMGVGFPGGTYEDIFYVADILCTGEIANGEMHIALDSVDFLAVFPMKGAGRVRLVGSVKHNLKENANLQWEDVSNEILERMKINVTEVKWFSTYRVHHRVAEHFRQGNVFLLGDAGHIHSPVGGQGMNTGVGDAVNLAWKLSAVLKGHASTAILDTYETERIAFAQKLVATTDRAFTFVKAESPVATFVRLDVVPFVIPRLFHSQYVRRMMFKILSQTSIKYPHSALSIGVAGSIKAGDRLPWIDADTSSGMQTDNYEPLTTMEWQAHCYGNVTTELTTFCKERNLQLAVFPFTDNAKEKGLAENAVYLVRPDGYVGLALPSEDVYAIMAYLGQFAIKL